MDEHRVNVFRGLSLVIATYLTLLPLAFAAAGYPNYYHSRKFLQTGATGETVTVAVPFIFCS